MAENADENKVDIDALIAKLEIELVSIESISEDPANARRHPTRNLEALKGSIRRFGQRKPIVVDEHNVIRAGNGFYRALKELGASKVNIVRMPQGGSEATAFAIADNRSGELSEWEYEALSEQLRGLRDEGVDLGMLGWEPHEVQPLLEAEWKPPEKKDLDAAGNDEKGDPIFVTKGQRETIGRAIATVRQQADQPDMSEGRALELLCADWLAGQTAMKE